MPLFLADDFRRLATLAPTVFAELAALGGQRLFLSGATGFFGKNLLALLAHLHRDGLPLEVTALSRDPDRFLRAAPWARSLPWLTWQRGDARDPWPAEGRYDLLLHAATDTHADAHRDLQAVFDGMLASTRQAMAFAERHGVRRLLLTGSGAQYGRLTGAPVTEQSGLACDPSLPDSAYGEAKRVAEVLAGLLGQRTGCQPVLTRCFAFLGPGLPLDSHFAAANFVRDALSGRCVRLQSSGSSVRSYLYSADLAVWLLWLLLHGPAAAPVNVGSDQGVSVLALAQRIRDRVGPGTPLSVGTDTGPPARAWYVPSIATARGLGLDSWTSLDAAILRTADWHRQNGTGRSPH